MAAPSANSPLPPSAMQRLPEIRTANRELISALEAHPAFAQQHPRRQGKVYFMWDFANRTDTMFQSILNDQPPPDTPATRHEIPNAPPSTMSEAQREALKQDAVGRCMMIWTLVTDTSGKTELMFGEAPGQGVDLGNGVKDAAENITKVIFPN